MRIFHSYDAEQTRSTETLPGTGRENLDIPRQQEVADVLAVARCPRCGAILVPHMKLGRPGFWCRCPVRRVRALAVPA